MPKGQESAYAQAGVNYQKIEPFKRRMIRVVKDTAHIAESRGVRVITDLAHAHGGVYEVLHHPAIMVQTTEGLGNKNWIAQWMNQCAGHNPQRYISTGICTAMMAVNDVIAQGAMPAIYTDEVAAGDSEWFSSPEAEDLAVGFQRACQIAGMSLVAGESPSLKYLVKAAPPVLSAPILSGTVTGIIYPIKRLIDGSKLCAGDIILGATSTGLHANGISLVIKKALELPDQFMKMLPTGRTLGDEALLPTRCYVDLIDFYLNAGMEIHSLIPGTGGGISKVAFDDRPFTYRIHSWPKVPIIFQFMCECGVPLYDCLTTFNWGVGYYIIVPPHEVGRALKLSESAGFEVMPIGVVQEGDRQVIFEPEDIKLPPPGD